MFVNQTKRDLVAAQLAYVQACKLVAITRNGRMNVFTFERNGEHFEIETMGMLSDDIAGWKTQAGLK